MLANLPMAQLQLFPTAASAQASQIDYLYWFITTISIIMTGVIFLGVV
ncbi:MAG: hypothetical protein JO108_21215, partial [Acidobacteriaceae bacterium]|nr:hypothetical protein [Acidobacteriaceae bacterium]